jgi:hypothetical protein
MQIHRLALLAALLTSPSFAQTLPGRIEFTDRLYKASGSPGSQNPPLISAQSEWGAGEIPIIALGWNQSLGGTDMDTKIWSYARTPEESRSYINIGRNRTDLYTPAFSITGNVGIGTTNPNAKLDIRGSVIAATPDFNLGASGSFLQIQQPVGTGNTYSDIGAFSSGGNAWNNLILQRAGGNVGIGTTNPEQKLHVSGGRFQINTAAAWDNFQIHTDGVRSYLEANGDESGLWILSNTGQKVIIPTANVGIGETNPQHKLAVNGTIKAKEIIVETAGWSDYVFADDYRLAPLAEVEAHIKTNKHLPGIPSAAQVAESGVNVGDVQAALLAKVEELTLHLIAQEKKIQALQTRNEALEALQARVSQLEAR